MKGTGAHFQTISTQSGATGQYGRSHSGAGAQNQLPAIAPRPSQLGQFEGVPAESIQEPHNDYYSTPVTATPSTSRDPYSSYASSYGGPGPASVDLPPRMRPMYQQQGSQSSGIQDTSYPRYSGGGLTGPASLPIQHGHYTGETSSGGSARQPSSNARWSQNLIPATTPTEYAQASYHHPALPSSQITANKAPHRNSQPNLQDYAPSSNSSYHLSAQYSMSTAGQQPPVSVSSISYPTTNDNYPVFDAQAWDIGQSQGLDAHGMWHSPDDIIALLGIGDFEKDGYHESWHGMADNLLLT